MNLDIDNKYIIDFMYNSGFYYKHENQTVMDIKTKKYFSLKRITSANDVRKHFEGKKIISLPLHYKNNVYVIDIDKRNNKENIIKIIDKIVEYIGNPFYLEKSVDSGGYHLYFRINKIVNSDIWVGFMNYFYKEYKYTIEPIYDLKSIKLPMSYYYSVYGEYDKIKKDRINKKSINEVIELFLSKEKIKYPEVFSKFKTNNDFKLIATSDRKIKNYKYGYSERNKTQIKIAFNCIYNNKDYDYFYNQCYQLNDGTSKDMKMSSFEINRMLKKIWKYAKEKFINIAKYNNNEINKLKLTDYRLKNSQKNKLEILLLKKYRKYNSKNKYGSMNEKKFIKETVRLIDILYNICYYRKYKDMKYLNEYDFLNEGIPLSKKLLSLIAKEEGIKNIFYKIKFLKNINFIKPIKNDKGYEYSYKYIRYCKHYILPSLSTL